MKTIKSYQKALNEVIKEIKENRKYPIIIFYMTQEDYKNNNPFYILFNPEYGKSVFWISLSIENFMYVAPEEDFSDDFVDISQRLILFTNKYKYLSIDSDCWDIDWSTNELQKENVVSKIINSSEDTYNHYMKIRRFERPDEYILDENEEICILTKDIHDKFLSYSLISAENPPSEMYVNNHILGYPCTKYFYEYNFNI